MSPRNLTVTPQDHPLSHSLAQFIKPQTVGILFRWYLLTGNNLDVRDDTGEIKMDITCQSPAPSHIRHFLQVLKTVNLPQTDATCACIQNGLGFLKKKSYACTIVNLNSRNILRGPSCFVAIHVHLIKWYLLRHLLFTSGHYLVIY